MVKNKPLRVGLLGCGTVGSEVVRLLQTQAAELAQRAGAGFEISAILVRDTTAQRAAHVDRALLTDDFERVLENSDLVVELLGGIEPARTYVAGALRAGRPVVTGNKALLAEHGPELFKLANEAGVDLAYEAAVAGAVPIVRGVRVALAGDRIERIMGIMNGTTNYILDEMTTRGLAFSDALAQAQELGYAEADPTADIEGHDAAAKIVLLASLAFHSRVSPADVHVEGISKITAQDVAAAEKSGHVIKLLAIAERTTGVEGPSLSVRVHPTLIPRKHPLAGVRGPYNAVYVQSAAAGELMFYGPGAGGAPTASAVLGDMVSVVRHIVNGGGAPLEPLGVQFPAMDLGEVENRFNIRLRVGDWVGVLAATAGIFAEYGVSVEAVRQEGEQYDAQGNRTVGLTVSTHAAPTSAVEATIAKLRDSNAVVRVESVLRIEGE